MPLDLMKIYESFRGGQEEGRRNRLLDLDEQGRALQGQVLAGDKSKLPMLMQVDAQRGMQTKQFTDEQQKAETAEFLQAAYSADTPQKWGQVVQRFRQKGHVFDEGEDRWENRENLMNEGMTLAEQRGWDLQKLKASQPTDDVREYNLAREQGFKGSFFDYQTALKQAGASKNVNINQAPAKGETKYQEELGKNLAGRWNALAEEGDTAAEGLAIVSQLRNTMPEGGLMTGIAGKLAEWGIGGAGMSDIQATQALVDRLTPKQRVPGSGTSSDLDVKMFKSGMPSLWKTPEGNAIILDTMEALELYKQARGTIAYQLMDGTMKREDAVQAFKALPDPFATFKAYRKRAAAGQDRSSQNARPQNGGKSDMATSQPSTLRTKKGVDWSIP